MRSTVMAGWCALLCAGMAAGAEVWVIGEGGSGKLAVGTAKLSASGREGVLFKQVLEADLERSGWFTVQRSGVAAIELAGTCESAHGETRVRCEARNLSTARRYFRYSGKADAGEVRALAHAVADRVVWEVKQVPGIASTRIVMVGARGRSKDIYLCDADGAGLVRATSAGAVCLAPNWWPDGRAVVYTSFHRGYPDVYRLDFVTRRRTRLAGFPGLNVGADISPDGRRMVLTLSKDGNPDLYVLDLRDRRLTRVTRTRHAAEASPSWSPDGQSIVYVSDSTGSPQVYVIRPGAARPKRLTFRGSENVAPDWGTAGGIAYSSRRGGQYHVCVMDGKGNAKQVSEGPGDFEDPSWAPDGRHLVCSRTVDYHADLYILDTLGDPPIRLTRLSGDWYSPAWSPAPDEPRF